MNFSISKRAREELLVILRHAGSDTQIHDASHLLRELVVQGSALSERSREQIPLEFRKLVIEACDAHLSPSSYVSGDLIRGLFGAGAGAVARRYVPRTQSLSLFNQLLSKLRDNPSLKLTERRLQSIESGKVLPAVERALLSYLEKLDLGLSGDSAFEITPWENYKVSFSARASRVGSFILRVTCEFVADQSEILIAVTSDEIVADRLCSEMPSVTDVFVPSEGMSARPILHMKSPTNSELANWVQVPLEEVDKKSEMLHLENQVIYPAVTFYCPGSEFTRADGSGRTYRLTSDQEILIDEGYCYWSAARRLKMRSVKADFSGFPNSEDYIFTVAPRFGKKVDVFEDQEAKWFEINANTWMDVGSSVTFYWRKGKA